MSAGKEIKIQNADFGYDSKGILTEGLLYGKTYQLEVLSDKKGLFRWSYVCKSALSSDPIPSKNGLYSDVFFPGDFGEYTTNVLQEREIDSLGEVIEFKIDDIGLCGSYIELNAYLISQTEIGDNSKSPQLLKVNGGETEIISEIEYQLTLKVWIPYRFRWFNRLQLRKEISERKLHPWKINQRGTALCGMACLFYILLEKDPEAYEILTLHLHQFGYVVHHGYFLKPSPKMLELNPSKDAEYPKGMAYADWITLASMRNMESKMGYTGKVSQVFASINWPPIMTKLSRRFLGFDLVEFKIYSLVKSYIGDYFLRNRKLEILRDQINRSHLDGFKILLLIDAGMLENKNVYSIKDYVNYHWVTYEGGLEFLNDEGKSESNLSRTSLLKFNVFSWGENPFFSRTSNGISRQAFIKNYYGYIRMK